MSPALTLLTSSFSLFALTGCGPGGGNVPIMGPGHTLERFTSCDDMRDYVAEAFTETILASRYGYGYGRGVYDDTAGGESDDGDASAPSDYSETNVQELGVDEADIVKTDGQYIYYTQDDTLFIIDSWPAEDTALAAELPLGGYPYSMFLDGDRLAVFSYVYNEEYEWDRGGEEPKEGEETEVAPGGDGEPGSPGDTDEGWKGYYLTRISIVDVSDRTTPEVVREVDLDGYYVNARMIDSDIYVVTTTWLEMPYDLWALAWDESLGLPPVDWEASEEEMDAARDAARAIVAPLVAEAVDDMSDGELLPLYRDQVPGEGAAPEVLLDCGDIYRPEHLSYPSFLTVAHLDLAGEGEVGAGSDVSGTGLMSEGWTVYASTDHLFVAQTSWYWWWGWGDYDIETHVHQFSLEGADSIYEASGAVDGWLLNQFSMSEYDGYLRVATTDTLSWGWGEDVAVSEDGGTSEGATAGGSEVGADADAIAKAETEPGNNVFVLQHTGDELAQVGELRGLAPEEQIYAVRFIGDRGYMVTFRQVDPLFTIDLSDPAAPSLVGELKVPGYSAYLHPLSDDFVLAIGMDGTEEGTVTGLAVSLFDVSDFANPVLAAKYTLESDEWSYSEALYDHHAFTYHRGVLSFPAYVYDYDDETGDWDYFSGLIVVDVDTGEEGGAAALTELGRVDHADLVADSECYYERYYGEGKDDAYDPCEDDYWYAWMRRSVVVEDSLFSLSNYGVKVNELMDPSVELARVLFYPESPAALR